jgi:poly(3-hydroxybutyrate) depolymerase
MRKIPSFALLSLVASSAFALTGTVKDTKGVAISGASLSLVSNPSSKTSTGTNGEFSLDVSTSVAPRGRDGTGLVGLEVQAGRLLLTFATAAEPGAVSLVSSDGRRLVLARGMGESGALGYALPTLPPGLYLVHIGALGGAAKLVSTGEGKVLVGAPSLDLASPEAALRAAAAIDTLVASKDGYTTVKTAITSYDQTGLAIVLNASAPRSAGCDKTKTLANGTLSIQSGGKTRKYILNVPASYDKSKPYRLVFAFAESGSSAQSVATRNYFRMAGYDTKNTIFVAPDAENGAGSWSKNDVAFTDAILAQLEGDLCIDKSRIFATGFSFGGAMSLALACTRADVFRGVAFFSGADLTGSCPSTPLAKPIAYYASQASGDASGDPIPSSGRIKQAQFAAVNGCTAEPNATVFPAAGKAHTCTVYKNCKAGYPTVYCVFNGPHGWEPNDPGQSTSWNPPEAWKFITQF